VAYFLLTGTPVFQGTPMQVIQSHLTSAPESPSARLGRPVPARLERLVLDCLQKDPALRPESARALAARLDACDDVPRWSADDARRWWALRAGPGSRPGKVGERQDCGKGRPEHRRRGEELPGRFRLVSCKERSQWICVLSPTGSTGSGGSNRRPTLSSRP